MKQNESIHGTSNMLFDVSSTMGLRGIFLSLAVLLVMVFSMLVSSPALASSLKSSATIQDDVIRLGDLFDGLSEEAATVLGAAPKPGKEMVLNARTLMRIASAYNVSWQPESVTDQVIVRRTAHTIGTDEIREVLQQAIAAKGYDGKFELLLNNPDAQIIMGGNQIPTLDVKSLNVFPTRNVFEAVLVAPSKENPVHSIALSGQIQQVIDVPVLKSAIKSGDIIGSSDIDWMEIPVKSVSGDLIMDADDMIGKTPARMLVANKPVRVREISAPQLIDRGEEITILYKQGVVNLSVKGKAMQNGVLGETIRVLNVASNKSVMAQVTESKQATVQ